MAATLGDHRALAVWATYNRWPLFAFVLAFCLPVIAFIGSLLFGGGVTTALTVLIEFLIGGFLGAVIGVLMGKDKQMFPVWVDVTLAYGGGTPDHEGVFPARATTLSFSDEDGKIVEARRIQYLQGMLLRQLPNFSLPTWSKVEHELATKRKLSILKVDSNRSYPIIWEKGILTCYDIPEYEGEIVSNEDGSKVTKIRYDKEGNPVVKGFKKVELIDTNVIDDNGKTVQIPKGITAKMDNDRVTYTQGVRLANTFNKTGDWWSRNAHLIVTIIAVFAILMIGIYSVSQFSSAVSGLGDKVAQSSVQSAQLTYQTAQINLAVLSALQKAGYNITVNTTGLITSTTPPVPTTGGSINIPFVTH